MKIIQLQVKAKTSGKLGKYWKTGVHCDTPKFIQNWGGGGGSSLPCPPPGTPLLLKCEFLLHFRSWVPSIVLFSNHLGGPKCLAKITN